MCGCNDTDVWLSVVLCVCAFNWAVSGPQQMAVLGRRRVGVSMLMVDVRVGLLVGYALFRKHRLRLERLVVLQLAVWCKLEKVMTTKGTRHEFCVFSQSNQFEVRYCTFCLYVYSRKSKQDSDGLRRRVPTRKSDGF